MKILNYLLIPLCLCSNFALADAKDIAHGRLKGIKVYDQATFKATKVYFDDQAKIFNSDCEGVAIITHSKHSDKGLEQITSLALSAYMAGKKVRAFSLKGTCELDFLAIQESYF